MIDQKIIARGEPTGPELCRFPGFGVARFRTTPGVTPGAVLCGVVRRRT